MDDRINPPVVGTYPVYSLDEVWDLLDSPELLPPPVLGRDYHLVYVDSDAAGGLPDHPRLTRLGFDLSDDDHESWSLLHDPCMWVGELAAIFARTGEYGLLGYEDAKRAQTLFQEGWPGIAGFRVLALYEIALDAGTAVAELMKD